MNYSAKTWQQRRAKDPYVKSRLDHGYRSRAGFKLQQIASQHNLINKGAMIIDLGSAPGSWSQVAQSMSAGNARIIACDILPMPAIEGVEFVCGDFTEVATSNSILALLTPCQATLIMSDMAPNFSGIRTTDQALAMELADNVLDFANQALQADGNLLIKLFQGSGFEQWIKDARRAFTRVLLVKPDASRQQSREQYALALGFKPTA